MKKTIRTKVFASLIAAVCAVSAITTVSMISASAYNNGNDLVSKSYVITAETYGDTFVMPIKGENWNYYADLFHLSPLNIFSSFLIILSLYFFGLKLSFIL